MIIPPPTNPENWKTSWIEENKQQKKWWILSNYKKEKKKATLYFVESNPIYVPLTYCS